MINERLNKDVQPGHDSGGPEPRTNGESDSAETIKDAHATGIGSLGRNDEKLDEENKTGTEDSGIIKD